MPLSSLPAFFAEKLKNQYGEELAEHIFDGFCQGRKTTCRINRLKTTSEQIVSLLHSEGIPFTRCPWWEDAFLFDEGSEERLRALPAYESGMIYLQSLSSMLPPLFVEPRAGERILDMAAAPGGKTTQMASLSENKALITACEKNKIRAERLSYNVKKQGATKCSVLVQDGASLSPYMSFDKVLLDAPCSGSGTLVEREGKMQRLFSEKMLSACVKAQSALLEKAIELVKRGGEIVYSTCSILREENEDPVERACRAGRVEVIPLDTSPFVGAEFLPTRIEGTLCVCPNGEYEGFFVSKLKKIK